MALWQIELPLLVLPLIAVLTRSERNLVDAAETLGAGRWRVFVTVLLPMMAPAILSGWVLVFASATTSYVTHSAIGGARLIYLPQFVYREIGILYQWPLAAAVAFLLLVSTGAVMVMLSALGRHKRLAVYA
jgi:putative spermidine/putrescine transport system permease protein